ncbi:MAG: RluA family pseudouridine synthase [Oscillospiraceae bacterium]|nr:RluA family pseudouridine synthase [Oscillospiraceae bacterium]
MPIMKQAEFTADASEEGLSCGELLKRRGVSRRLTVKLKRLEDGITVNGKQIRTVDTVHAGDIISLRCLDESLLEPNSSLYVPVVYEDEQVVVFNKPAAMPVHPSVKHQGDTLGNCFAAMYPGLTFRPVNRLDRDTSGLCAAAKSKYAANLLAGNISKVYYAVTEGKPVPHDMDDISIKWYKTGNSYRIEAPIGRAGESIIRREIRRDGQYAATEYTILESDGKHSLVRVLPETGRTHQIRVHFSSVGHPLAGDDLYGGSRSYCQEQALHCGEMSLIGSSGRTVSLFCPLRENMQKLIDGGSE